LVERNSRRDEDFARIVEHYKGYLMAVILPVIRDPEQAQDVLQETFCQAYRSLPSFQGGNIKFWLSHIAVRKAVDWARRQERRRREVLQAEPGEGAPATVRSAEEEYLKLENSSRLAAALKNLPLPYRLTLTGYCLEGKSYRQLAEEAGITVKTVESRLYRARRILKQEMEEGL